MCAHLYIHNKYTQYTHIYYVTKSFILDEIKSFDSINFDLMSGLFKLQNILFFFHLFFTLVLANSKIFFNIY